MENDLPNAKMHNRRYWIGFAFSVASFSLGITGMIIGVVFYHRLRITHSFNSHLAALGVLVILTALLLLVGALGLVGYLLMIIKNRREKNGPDAFVHIGNSGRFGYRNNRHLGDEGPIRGIQNLRPGKMGRGGKRPRLPGIAREFLLGAI